LDIDFLLSQTNATYSHYGINTNFVPRPKFSQSKFFGYFLIDKLQPKNEARASHSSPFKLPRPSNLYCQSTPKNRKQNHFQALFETRDFHAMKKSSKLTTSFSNSARLFRMNIRVESHRLVDALKEDSTWDDLMCEIYIRQMVETGIKDLNEGRVHDLDAVRANFTLNI
jgi:hypothetical protein